MQNSRTSTLVLFLTVVVGAIFYLQSHKPSRNEQQVVEVKPALSSMTQEEKAKQYPLAKEITTPDGFINADKISVSELIGKKIVLIDFWTYSCINCQRTTPYLNAWYKKYKDEGLVIIGVHTPEFAFEQKYENVLAAVKKLGINFPVVLDNDYSTWNAYGNRYWPRKYLIDIDGYIVYDHIGEGAYEETEKKVQELLEERRISLGVSEEFDKGISSPQGALNVDFSAVRSPEIYFGAARNTSFGNGNRNTVGPQHLSEPARAETDVLYLSGDWDFYDEFAENKSGQAKIIFRYQAKDVYFVAGSENSTKIRITNDGKFIGETEVGEHTLYPVVQNSEYGEHTLEIIIENPGLRAFTFTFG